VSLSKGQTTTASEGCCGRLLWYRQDTVQVISVKYRNWDWDSSYQGILITD
jgi:hypothetical protein